MRGRVFDYEEVARLRESGLQIPQIAKRLGCDKSSVSRICAIMGVKRKYDEHPSPKKDDPGFLGATPPPSIPKNDPLLARLRAVHGEMNV